MAKNKVDLSDIFIRVHMDSKDAKGEVMELATAVERVKRVITEMADKGIPDNDKELQYLTKEYNRLLSLYNQNRSWFKDIDAAVGNISSATTKEVDAVLRQIQKRAKDLKNDNEEDQRQLEEYRAQAAIVQEEQKRRDLKRIAMSKQIKELTTLTTQQLKEGADEAARLLPTLGNGSDKMKQMLQFAISYRSQLEKSQGKMSLGEAFQMSGKGGAGRSIEELTSAQSKLQSYVNDFGQFMSDRQLSVFNKHIGSIRDHALNAALQIANDPKVGRIDVMKSALDVLRQMQDITEGTQRQGINNAVSLLDRKIKEARSVMSEAPTGNLADEARSLLSRSKSGKNEAKEEAEAARRAAEEASQARVKAAETEAGLQQRMDEIEAQRKVNVREGNRDHKERLATAQTELATSQAQVEANKENAQIYNEQTSAIREQQQVRDAAQQKAAEHQAKAQASAEKVAELEEQRAAKQREQNKYALSTSEGRAQAQQKLAEGQSLIESLQQKQKTEADTLVAIDKERLDAIERQNAALGRQEVLASNIVDMNRQNTELEKHVMPTRPSTMKSATVFDAPDEALRQAMTRQSNERNVNKAVLDLREKISAGLDGAGEEVIDKFNRKFFSAMKGMLRGGIPASVTEMRDKMGEVLESIIKRVKLSEEQAEAVREKFSHIGEKSMLDLRDIARSSTSAITFVMREFRSLSEQELKDIDNFSKLSKSTDERVQKRLENLKIKLRGFVTSGLSKLAADSAIPSSGIASIKEGLSAGNFDQALRGIAGRIGYEKQITTTFGSTIGKAFSGAFDKKEDGDIAKEFIGTLRYKLIESLKKYVPVLSSEMKPLIKSLMDEILNDMKLDPEKANNVRATFEKELTETVLKPLHSVAKSARRSQTGEYRDAKNYVSDMLHGTSGRSNGMTGLLEDNGASAQQLVDQLTKADKVFGTIIGKLGDETPEGLRILRAEVKRVMREITVDIPKMIAENNGSLPKEIFDGYLQSVIKFATDVDIKAEDMMKNVIKKSNGMKQSVRELYSTILTGITKNVSNGKLNLSQSALDVLNITEEQIDPTTGTGTTLTERMVDVVRASAPKTERELRDILSDVIRKALRSTGGVAEEEIKSVIDYVMSGNAGTKGAISKVLTTQKGEEGNEKQYIKTETLRKMLEEKSYQAEDRVSQFGIMEDFEQKDRVRVKNNTVTEVVTDMQQASKILSGTDFTAPIDKLVKSVARFEDLKKFTDGLDKEVDRVQKLLNDKNYVDEGGKTAQYYEKLKMVQQLTEEITASLKVGMTEDDKYTVTRKHLEELLKKQHEEEDALSADISKRREQIEGDRAEGIDVGTATRILSEQENKLAVTGKFYDEVGRGINTLTDEQNAWTEAQKRAEKQNERNKQQIESNNQAIADATQQIEVEKQNEIDAAKAVEEHTARLAEQQAVVDKSAAARAELEKSQAELTTALTETENATRANFENKIIETLDKRRESINAEIKKLKQQNEDTEKALENIDQLKGKESVTQEEAKLIARENEFIKSKADTEKKINDLYDERSTVMKRIDEHRVLSTAAGEGDAVWAERMGEYIKSIKDQLADLEAEKQKVLASNPTNSRSTDGLNLTAAEHDFRNQSVDAQLSVIGQQADEFRAMSAKYVDASQKYHNFSKEAADVTNEIADAQQKIQRIEASLLMATDDSKIKSYTEKLKELEEEIPKLKSKLESIDLAGAEREFKEAESEYNAKKSQLARSKQVTTASDELVELTISQSDSRSRLAETSKTLADYNTQQTVNAEKTKQLGTEIDSLNGKIAANAAQQRKQNEEAEKQQHIMEQADAAIEQHKATLAGMGDAIKEVFAANERLSKAEATLAAIEQENPKATADAEAMRLREAAIKEVEDARLAATAATEKEKQMMDDYTTALAKDGGVSIARLKEIRDQIFLRKENTDDNSMIEQYGRILADLNKRIAELDAAPLRKVTDVLAEADDLLSRPTGKPDTTAQKAAVDAAVAEEKKQRAELNAAETEHGKAMVALDQQRAVARAEEEKHAQKRQLWLDRQTEAQKKYDAANQQSVLDENTALRSQAEERRRAAEEEKATLDAKKHQIQEERSAAGFQKEQQLQTAKLDGMRTDIMEEQRRIANAENSERQKAIDNQKELNRLEREAAVQREHLAQMAERQKSELLIRLDEESDPKQRDRLTARIERLTNTHMPEMSPSLVTSDAIAQGVALEKQHYEKIVGYEQQRQELHEKREKNEGHRLLINEKANQENLQTLRAFQKQYLDFVKANEEEISKMGKKTKEALLSESFFRKLREKYRDLFQSVQYNTDASFRTAVDKMFREDAKALQQALSGLTDKEQLFAVGQRVRGNLHNDYQIPAEADMTTYLKFEKEVKTEAEDANKQVTDVIANLSKKQREEIDKTIAKYDELDAKRKEQNKEWQDAGTYVTKQQYQAAKKKKEEDRTEEDNKNIARYIEQGELLKPITEQTRKIMDDFFKEFGIKFWDYRNATKAPVSAASPAASPSTPSAAPTVSIDQVDGKSSSPDKESLRQKLSESEKRLATLQSAREVIDKRKAIEEIKKQIAEQQKLVEEEKKSQKAATETTEKKQEQVTFTKQLTDEQKQQAIAMRAEIDAYSKEAQGLFAKWREDGTYVKADTYKKEKEKAEDKQDKELIARYEAQQKEVNSVKEKANAISEKYKELTGDTYKIQTFAKKQTEAQTEAQKKLVELKKQEVEEEKKLAALKPESFTDSDLDDKKNEASVKKHKKIVKDSKKALGEPESQEAPVSAASPAASPKPTARETRRDEYDQQDAKLQGKIANQQGSIDRIVEARQYSNVTTSLAEKETRMAELRDLLANIPQVVTAYNEWEQAVTRLDAAQKKYEKDKDDSSLIEKQNAEAEVERTRNALIDSASTDDQKAKMVELTKAIERAADADQSFAQRENEVDKQIATTTEAIQAETTNIAQYDANIATARTALEGLTEAQRGLNKANRELAQWDEKHPFVSGMSEEEYQRQRQQLVDNLELAKQNHEAAKQQVADTQQALQDAEKRGAASLAAMKESYTEMQHQFEVAEDQDVRDQLSQRMASLKSNIDRLNVEPVRSLSDVLKEVAETKSVQRLTQLRQELVNIEGRTTDDSTRSTALSEIRNLDDRLKQMNTVPLRSLTSILADIHAAKSADELNALNTELQNLRASGTVKGFDLTTLNGELINTERRIKELTTVVMNYGQAKSYLAAGKRMVSGSIGSTGSLDKVNAKDAEQLIENLKIAENANGLQIKEKQEIIAIRKQLEEAMNLSAGATLSEADANVILSKAMEQAGKGMSANVGEVRKYISLLQQARQSKEIDIELEKKLAATEKELNDMLQSAAHNSMTATQAEEAYAKAKQLLAEGGNADVAAIKESIEAMKKAQTAQDVSVESARQYKNMQKLLEEQISSTSKAYLHFREIKEIYNNDNASAKEIEDAIASLQRLTSVSHFPVDVLARYNDMIKQLQERLNKTHFDKNFVDNTVKNVRTAPIKDLERALKMLQDKMVQVSRSAGENAKEFLRMREDAKKLEREIKSAKEGVTSFSDAVKHQGDFLTSATNKLLSYIGVFGGFYMIRQKMQEVLQENIKYSDSLTNIQKTTQMTAESVEQLAMNIKRIDTRTSLQDITNLAYAAGRLGVKGTADVMGFVRAADHINIALGEQLNGAESVEQLMKITELMGTTEEFGLEKALEKTGSALNVLTMNTVATSQPIVDFMRRLAGVSTQAGVSTSELTGLGAAVNALGQNVEMSATSISKIMVQISSNSKKVAAALKLDSDEAERFYYDIAAGRMTDALLTVLQKVNEAGGLSHLGTIVKDLGSEGQRVIQTISTLASNYDKVESMIKMSNKAFEEGTSVIDEYNLKNENAAAQWERLKNKFSKMFISPATIKWITELLKKLQDLPNDIKRVANSLEGAWKVFKIFVGLITNCTFVVEAFLQTLVTRAVYQFIGGIVTMCIQLKQSIVDFRNARKAGESFTSSLKKIETSGVLQILTAITSALYLIYDLATASARETKQMWQELDGEMQRAKDQTQAESANLSILLRRLKEAGKGTQARVEIINKLNTQYGEYLGHQLRDAMNNKEIEESLKGVNNQLRIKAMLSAKEEAYKRIQEQHRKAKTESYSGMTESLLGMMDKQDRSTASIIINDLIQNPEQLLQKDENGNWIFSEGNGFINWRDNLNKIAKIFQDNGIGTKASLQEANAISLVDYSEEDKQRINDYRKSFENLIFYLQEYSNELKTQTEQINEEDAKYNAEMSVEAAARLKTHQADYDKAWSQVFSFVTQGGTLVAKHDLKDGKAIKDENGKYMYVGRAVVDKENGIDQTKYWVDAKTSGQFANDYNRNKMIELLDNYIREAEQAVLDYEQVDIERYRRESINLDNARQARNILKIGQLEDKEDKDKSGASKAASDLSKAVIDNIHAFYKQQEDYFTHQRNNGIISDTELESKLREYEIFKNYTLADANGRMGGLVTYNAWQKAINEMVSQNNTGVQGKAIIDIIRSLGDIRTIGLQFESKEKPVVTTIPAEVNDIAIDERAAASNAADASAANASAADASAEAAQTAADAARGLVQASGDLHDDLSDYQKSLLESYEKGVFWSDERNAYVELGRDLYKRLGTSGPNTFYRDSMGINMFGKNWNTGSPMTATASRLPEFGFERFWTGSAQDAKNKTFGEENLEVGDILVSFGTTRSGKDTGHYQMWVGDHWVSDTNQTSTFVYPKGRMGDMSAQIFRHPDVAGPYAKTVTTPEQERLIPATSKDFVYYMRPLIEEALKKKSYIDPEDIPALVSILTAQAANESGYMQSGLSKKYYNLSGMTAGTVLNSKGTTGVMTNSAGKDPNVYEVFDSVEDWLDNWLDYLNRKWDAFGHGADQYWNQLQHSTIHPGQRYGGNSADSYIENMERTRETTDRMWNKNPNATPTFNRMIVSSSSYQVIRQSPKDMSDGNVQLEQSANSFSAQMRRAREDALLKAETKKYEILKEIEQLWLDHNPLGKLTQQYQVSFEKLQLMMNELSGKTNADLKKIEQDVMASYLTIGQNAYKFDISNEKGLESFKDYLIKFENIRKGIEEVAEEDVKNRTNNLAEVLRGIYYQSFQYATDYEEQMAKLVDKQKKLWEKMFKQSKVYTRGKAEAAAAERFYNDMSQREKYGSSKRVTLQAKVESSAQSYVNEVGVWENDKSKARKEVQKAEALNSKEGTPESQKRLEEAQYQLQTISEMPDSVRTAMESLKDSMRDLQDATHEWLSETVSSIEQFAEAFVPLRSFYDDKGDMLTNIFGTTEERQQAAASFIDDIKKTLRKEATERMKAYITRKFLEMSFTKTKKKEDKARTKSEEESNEEIKVGSEALAAVRAQLEQKVSQLIIQSSQQSKIQRENDDVEAGTVSMWTSFGGAVAKAWEVGGPYLGPVLAAIVSAALGSLMTMVFNMIGHDSHGGSSSASKTRLVSGMLTYDRGNVQSVRTYADGKKVPVMGDDGRLYYADEQHGTMQTGMVTKPTLTTIDGQPALVGERGPEMVIGRETTAAMQMYRPDLIREIALFDKNRSRGFTKTYDAGTPVSFAQVEGPSTTALTAADIQQMRDTMQQLVLINEQLTTQLAKGIKASINKYGAGGILDEVSSGFLEQRRNGSSKNVTRLFSR